MNYSIILPTLNENGHIIDLIKEISNILGKNKKDYEIIVVDDSSTDGTYETVKEFKRNNSYLKLISRKNKRKNLADSINEGISQSKFDNIIWMDADFQHPPKYIETFINKSKDYDVIISSRFLKKSNRYFKDPKFKKETNENQSYLYNNLCRFFLFKDITDYTSGFVCIKKNCLKDYKLKGFYGDYFVDMILNFKKKNINIIEIPFKDGIRASGSSKTLVNINIKYIYTCFRYFVTLIKSILKLKFNK